MAIIRVNKTSGYTVMSNTHLRDKNLSLKAKGLMSQMLALPEDWDYSIAGLAAINQESESAIKSALKELQNSNYLIITKLTPDKTESGRFEYIYDLYEDPQEEKQETKKQEVEILPLEIQPIEILTVENQRQLNKEELNKDKQNKEESNKEGLIVRDERKKSNSDLLSSVTLIRENPDLLEAFIDFIEMRKKIKKPLTTERAIKMLVNKTFKLAEGDPAAMIAILNQSIMGSWSGVYPLKEERNIPNNAQNAALNPFAAMLREEGYS